MRRAKDIRAVFLMLLLLLCGRLYYVQILCGEELTVAAQGQQMIPVVQENGRGTIYDRNMTPLTGTNRVYYYLIHKDNLTAGAERQLTRMGAEQAGQKGEDYLVYRTTQYLEGAAFVLQKRHKAYGFCVDVRYGENQTAAPLLADLDVMYDSLLQKGEPAFYFLGNAAGGLFQGTGVSLPAKADAAALVTTLDADLQRQIEEIFEDGDVTGCAVVTDAGTRQVLAMVSRDEAETSRNLSVEQAYPIGALYELVKKTAAGLNVEPLEAAEALGLGAPAFDCYPREDTGEMAGKKTTTTAVQLSRILTMLANQGQAMPLTIVMSTVKEESIPCMEMTGDGVEKLRDLHEELVEKSLSGDGWAAGYSGNYAVIVHLEKGNPEKTYDLIVNRL